MKKTMKTTCMVLFVASFVLLTLAAMGNRKTYAGGGINYKVTVSNPTDKTCFVWIMVEKGYVRVSKETAKLSPGGSYTWETGAICPCGLRGEVLDPVSKEVRRMQCVNMYGNRSDCNSGLGDMAACASHNFTIERKVGVTEVREYDFGFRKN